MAVKKFSISMNQDTLDRMEFLREKFKLFPGISRSQLISVIIFESYCRYHPTQEFNKHGFPDCQDDCNSCADAFVCDYFKGW